MMMRIDNAGVACLTTQPPTTTHRFLKVGDWGCSCDTLSTALADRSYSVPVGSEFYIAPEVKAATVMAPYIVSRMQQ
jgi:hypothetical protein